MAKRIVKRMLDLCLVAASLPLVAPIILLLMLLVRLQLGSPVFFAQGRPGLKGRIFHMVKFRSMTQERDSNGRLLPDEQRLTRFGKFLRTTSLDELPELWNVFKGDMSLVGPRPLLVEYLNLYSERHKRRHLLRPGITGWAQINGRNALDWNEKFDLDVWYVDNQSLWLDLKILALTLVRVLQCRGIAARSHATMPRFTGSADQT
jgi:lipopolysaccharide/colanic/teichoic acid biosynthesis glycosyltransferase